MTNSRFLKTDLCKINECSCIIPITMDGQKLLIYADRCLSNMYDLYQIQPLACQISKTDEFFFFTVRFIMHHLLGQKLKHYWLQFIGRLHGLTGWWMCALVATANTTGASRLMVKACHKLMIKSLSKSGTDTICLCFGFMISVNLFENAQVVLMFDVIFK